MPVPGNPRAEIIEEMMQTYVQSVSAERVAAYYKRLEDIPEDALRVACIACVENGQQRGVPSVAEIRRRAGELRSRGSRLGEPVDEPKERPEHAETVARLRGWNHSEVAISDVLDGAPCPTGPTRFSERGVKLMARIAAKRGKTLADMGLVLEENSPSSSGVRYPEDIFEEEEIL